MDTNGIGDQQLWYWRVSDIGCRPPIQIAIKLQGNCDPPMNFGAHYFQTTLFNDGTYKRAEMCNRCVLSVDSAGSYYPILGYTLSFFWVNSGKQAVQKKQNQCNAIMQNLLQFSLGDTCIEHPPVSELIFCGVDSLWGVPPKSDYFLIRTRFDSE